MGWLPLGRSLGWSLLGRARELPLDGGAKQVALAGDALRPSKRRSLQRADQQRYLRSLCALVPRAVLCVAHAERGQRRRRRVARGPRQIERRLPVERS
eukprot:scaffold47745_cov68-Phaeocystis_antarctica.AAC.5